MVEVRKIKFRAWDGKEMKEAFDLSSNPKYWWKDNEDYPLMQYTGLNDKNGVEIYEGDIVKAFDEYNETEFIGEVKYGSGSFCITDNKGFSGYRLMDYDMEVLGNIYENKELLE